MYLTDRSITDYILEYKRYKRIKKKGWLFLNIMKDDVRVLTVNVQQANSSRGDLTEEA